jgi:hypothetical protein
MIDVITRTPSHNHVVVLLEDVPDFYKLPAQVKVYRLGVPTKWRRSRLPLLWAKARFMLVAMSVRPNVVVGWSHAGFIAACALKHLFGTKAIWTVHSQVDDEYISEKEHAARLAQYRLLDPDVVHYPAERSRLVHEQCGIPSKGAVVIQHAIDDVFFAVGRARAQSVKAS